MGINILTAGGNFADPARSFTNLEAALVASVVTASTDIALVLDAHGVVTDVAMNESVLSSDIYATWIGQPFIDIVTVESRLKVKRLLTEDIEAEGNPRREINHPLPDGQDLPVSYSVLPLSAEGKKLALGRDLRVVATLQQKLVETQIALDSEYERLKGVESQYRILFDSDNDIHFLIDPATRRVVDANATARKAFETRGRALPGNSIENFIDRSSLEAIDRLISAAHSSGRIETAMLAMRGSKTPVPVAAHFFRQQGAARLSLRLGRTGGFGEEDDQASLFAHLGQRLPDAIVLLDTEMRIVSANDSFLDLIQVATLPQAVGQSLTNWFGHRGVELTVLKNAIDAQGAVRNLATTVRPRHSAPIGVEVSAAAVNQAGTRYYGLSIRIGERSRTIETATPSATLRPENEMTGLVGKVPLREIVRETTDIIEKLCIEAALELTRNNRASAAEMLGLSRQSLYTKLRRFEIIGDDDKGPGA